MATVDITDLPSPSASKAENIDDLPSPKKKSLPASQDKFRLRMPEETPEQKESFKRNRALMLGLGTSLATPIGSFESMMTPEAKGELKGQETIFTTPKQLREGLQKYGIVSKLSPEEEKYAEYGEIGPAVGAAGYLGGRALKQGLGLAADYIGGTPVGKAIGRGYEALTGKAAKEAEKQAQSTRAAIEQAGVAGKQEVGKRAEESAKSEFEKRARQEASLKGAEKKFMTAAEKERQDAAMKFADLKSPDPRIKDAATLGDEMQRRIVGAEATVSSRRSQQASRDYGAYFEEAKGFEESKPRELMLEKLRKMVDSPSAGSAEREAASKALVDLAASKDAVGAEKEFRKYFEGASGPPQPGYGAIQQEASKKVSDIIGEALNTHAPKRIETRKTYSEFSTPLDAFETLFGKKGVKEEAAVAGRIQMQPSQYPSTYFKDRDTIRALREQLRGDEAAVRKFANAQAVNELEGKNAAQAKQWFDKNKSWVNEVPGLNTRVEKYVQELARSEQAAATKTIQAEQLGKTKEKVIQTGQATEQQIRDLAKSQKEKIDDMLIKLNTLDPEKSAGAAKSMIDTLSTMRDINGKTIVSPSELNNLQMQMQMVENAYGKSEKAAQLRKSLIYKTLSGIGIGGFGAYYGAKYFGD